MIYIRRDDAILLCCIRNNYFFSIQVGLDIFVSFNRDVEPKWACNLHEYYTDFRSRFETLNQCGHVIFTNIILILGVECRTSFVNIKRGRNFFPNNTWDGNLMLFYN